MRRLLILVLTLAMTTNAFAVVKKPINKKPPVQRTEHTERPVEKTQLGFYLTPEVKIGEIANEVRGMIGIRAGLELNHSIYLGLAGYGLPEDEQSRSWYCHECEESVDWELGYGGLEFGVMAGTPRTGLISMGVLIGGGGVHEDRRFYTNTQSFFVLEPQLDLAIHLGQNVRLNLGGSYRFVDDLNSLRYTQEDLEGPSFNIGVSVGIL
jgi:hypothetical protein